MRIIIVFLLFLISITSWGQISMTKGFEYLESGQFKEAEFFFEDLLKKEPNNKTATLCYHYWVTPIH